ncbi:MAG: hypothetical protein N3A69_14045, partial [Leptospiraceae bacterium]|nr:hypothetical protein [Leptospiraceae bacterium]
YYSAPEIRIKAVESHYNDMVNEQGNEVVKKLFNFIQSPDIPQELRYIFLSYEELKKLIQLAKQKQNIEEETEEVIQKLVNLGIISEPRHRNQGMFSFALLYKYYLNLKGRKIVGR